MTSIETVSIVIAAISVVIGVINSIRSNQKAEEQRQTEIETRQAELFTNIYNRWNTRDIQTAYGNIRHLWQWNGFEDFIGNISFVLLDLLKTLSPGLITKFS